MAEEKQTRRSVNSRFLKQLEAEVEAWKQQGKVTDQQARSILSQYVVVSPLYGRLIVVLVTLGAVLAGIGIIIFVSTNWQEIPKFMKIILIIIMVLAVYFLGYWLKYEKNFPRAGGAVIFIGAMVFGAALFLVGQQYHVPIEDPWLMMWWFVGIVPVAYFTRSKAVLTLAIIALLAAFGYKSSQWFDGVRDGYYAICAFYMMLGLGLYGIGVVHTRYERLKYYTSRYQVFGLIIIFGLLYILSFKDIYKTNYLTGWELSALPTAFTSVFHIIAALVFISIVWSFIIDARKNNLCLRQWGELAAVFIFILAGYLALILPFTDRVPYAVIFNLLLFGGIIGLIFLGYFGKKHYMVNIALVFFGLGIIGRYVDFVRDLLPTSLFFIIGGLLLLGLGIFLERLRRKTLQRMQAIEVSDENET